MECHEPKAKRISAAGIPFAPGAGDGSSFHQKSNITLKIWILALSAAVLAARVTYSFMNRASRSGRFAHDQVSSDWLATARIHEDQG